VLIRVNTIQSQSHGNYPQNTFTLKCENCHAEMKNDEIKTKRVGRELWTCLWMAVFTYWWKMQHIYE